MEKEVPMKKHTICRLCSACCPIEAETENGKLVSARRKSILPGDKQLVCPKLDAAAEIVYSPKRLLKPLIRDGNGFREASWDEALNVVAKRFLHSKQAYGAESVCWLRGMAADWGAPWDYVNRLMNVFGSPNCIGNGSICFVGRDFAHTAVYGTMTMAQISNARCIIVWGKNDKDTAPNAAESMLQAQNNGAKLIVIDPVKTYLAGKADIWLQIKPAHDGLLAMAMIHEIISNNLYDRAFIRDWTIGFDQLKNVAGDYPVDKIAEEIWLDPTAIRDVVKLYTAIKPACIIDGNGLDMQLESFDATRAVAMLRALTGNLDITGGDLLPKMVPNRNLQLKELLPKDVVPITTDYALFNNFHPYWGRQVQSCVIDSILDEKPYPVKTLMVQSANPLVSFMDANRVQRALEKLEFLVVFDLFLTQTAQMADVILPASSSFENTQLDRAFIRCSPVRLQEQVVEPLGESRPTWKMVFDLARRIGLEKEFPWKTAEEAIDYQLEPAGITVEMLRKSPDGIMAEPVKYQKYLTEGFKTPSGKVEFYSEQLAKHGHAPVPFINGHLKDPISFMDQADRFPLLGISGQRNHRFNNSQYRVIPSLLLDGKDCRVDIHPEDARKYAVSNGDMVKVETPRGSIKMRARISEVTHPGVIRLAWGWGDYDPESSLNRLTDDDRRNPVIGTASGRNFMCRIEKVA